MISDDWRRRIGADRPADFASTLLFAFRFRSGRLLVGGIGDGLIAVAHPSFPRQCRLLERPGGDFGETFAISSTAGPSKWVVEEFDDSDCCHRVLLATDGVSNDLVESKLPNLMEWLRSSYERSSNMRWRVGIREMLRRWPTPGAMDDKSIALLWRTRGVST
jgi:hypothetical protein